MGCSSRLPITDAAGANRQLKRLSPSGYREAISSNVRILTPIPGRFGHFRRLRPDSDKTNGNSECWIVCRNTSGFPVLAEASLIGELTAFPQQG